MPVKNGIMSIQKEVMEQLKSAMKSKDKVALEWSKAMPVMLNGEKVVLIAEDFIYAVY